MRSKTRSLSRGVATQKQRDARYLQSTLQRDLSARETELVALLVSRYHDAAYQEINHMIFQRYPMELEVMLDNFDFVMSKIKGGGPSYLSHSAQVVEAYEIDPEMKCHWRTAPLPVRRKAVVIVRLSTLLEEAVNLPDGCYIEDGTTISPYLVEMGLKYWNRLDDLIALMLDDRILELPAIDMILEHGVATTLTDGAL